MIPYRELKFKIEGMFSRKWSQLEHNHRVSVRPCGGRRLTVGALGGGRGARVLILATGATPCAAAAAADYLPSSGD